MAPPYLRLRQIDNENRGSHYLTKFRFLLTHGNVGLGPIDWVPKISDVTSGFVKGCRAEISNGGKDLDAYLTAALEVVELYKKYSDPWELSGIPPDELDPASW